MRGRSKFSTEATLKTERWEMFLNLKRNVHRTTKTLNFLFVSCYFADKDPIVFGTMMFWMTDYFRVGKLLKLY